MISGAPPRVGTTRRLIYVPSLLYRDNGGAAADDTAKGYMRRVAGSDSTTSRWLSNEGCLPLHEKAARALHYST
jgi:hypothetical protein